MQYKSFTIERYRAITAPITIDLSRRMIPLVGINECGKTTILQAIFCFDYQNDKLYTGKHLLNTQNLYEAPQSQPPQITATIECTLKDIELAIQKAINGMERKNKNTTSTHDYSDDIESLKSYQGSIPKLKNIDITRTLADGNRYSCSVFENATSTATNWVCYRIIDAMPYIIYNDDFTDRPKSVIPISDEDTESSEWEDIYDKVFKLANSEYSLENTLNCEDERTRKTILSKVSNYLSKALTTSWAKFSPSAQKISVNLSINLQEKQLEVFIVEDRKGDESHFYISDRSKGFIWYYNFIMKIRFNPKESNVKKGTIFLLDEPGSYLHELAQTELCSKLKDISKNEGIVVYCTHSPKLLNPNHVPLNNILIVEKTKKGQVSTVPLPLKKTTAKKNSAMQPVYEALYIPEYEVISKDEKVLCVEGIHDKYAVECFCSFEGNIRLYPSQNAYSIINNISSFIAYGKNYIALWDNDEEGEKCFGQAKKIFGAHESNKFMLLPKMGKNKMMMETMIEDVDHQKLIEELLLPANTNYETMISTLYFMTDKRKKQKIIDGVSDETKQNFSALSKAIQNIYLQQFI